MRSVERMWQLYASAAQGSAAQGSAAQGSGENDDTVVTKPADG